VLTNPLISKRGRPAPLPAGTGYSIPSFFNL
jgi:hypothetical protein